MGRITIFSSDDCQHCSRAKACLKHRTIPFQEIDLLQFPQRRNDMMSLSNEYSIPQVFFNDHYIGGADDLLSFFLSFENVDAQSGLDDYLEDLASQPDPADRRLRVPTREEQKQAVQVESTTDACFKAQEPTISLPNGKEASVVQTIAILNDILDIADRTFNARTYTNCFINIAAITAIVDHFRLPSREDGFQFVCELQMKHQIIRHVSQDPNHEFSDKGINYFRLQCNHDRHTLNLYCIWKGSVSIGSANMIMLRLNQQLRQILTSYTDNNGLIDCVRAKDDDRYPYFEEAICVLQAIDMTKMDQSTRLAFGLNLYNLMISYAFIKVGVATTTFERSAFFNKVRFQVGGQILSFNDLEHGILRSNKRHPYSRNLSFGKGDPRRELSLDELDCRIHFGLNCGAKSCPPVRYFRSASVEEELRVVALSFCEQDESCFPDETKHMLYLSKIFKWFEKDFCSSKDQLPMVIVKYLKGVKKERLERMMAIAADKKKPISIKYRPYNWSAPVNNFVPYNSYKLMSDKFSPKALLRFEGRWNLRSNIKPTNKAAGRVK